MTDRDTIEIVNIYGGTLYVRLAERHGMSLLPGAKGKWADTVENRNAAKKLQDKKLIKILEPKAEAAPKTETVDVPKVETEAKAEIKVEPKPTVASVWPPPVAKKEVAPLPPDGMKGKEGFMFGSVAPEEGPQDTGFGIGCAERQ